MLPLRVELDGFLTYKEQTVLDFSGDWLWAITGKNGAGKSAVFDAITYALYGEHRGGKQHDERLISQGRDSACVAFHFAVGSHEYRVERTMTRQATRRKISYDKTCQAYHVVAAPGCTAPELLAIPDTDRKEGLEAWVVRTIGLTYGAFVSSVLLQQGRADRFVLARPRERQDILMELLDLDVYKRLEAAARAHQRRCAERITDLEAQLRPLSDATPAAVAEAQGCADTLKEQATKTEQATQVAAITLANAQRFAELDGKLRTAREALAQAEGVLANAEAIERDAAELQRVCATLPALEEIVRQRGRATELLNGAAELHRQAAAIDVAALIEEQSAREADATAAERAYGEARDATATARREAEALRPLAEAGAELARLQGEIAAADAELERLCRDLAEHDAAIEHEQRCADAERALQPLRELRRQRALAAAAEGQRREADEAQPELRAAAQALDEQARETRRQADEAAREVQDLRVAHAEARAVLTAAETELQERRAAQDEVTCSRCGQRVDAEHIRREIADAEQAAKSAREAVADLERRISVAEQDTHRLAGDATALEKQRDDAVERAAAASRTVEGEREKRDEALRQAEQAIEALPASYRDMAADELYPSEQELRDVEQQARGLKAATQERWRLDGLAQRTAVLEEQSDEKRRAMDTVCSQHPGADLAAAPSNYQALQKRIAALAATETDAWTAWQGARERATGAADAARAAAERHTALLGEAAAKEADAGAAEGAAAALEGSLALDWRAVTPTEAAALEALQRRAGELAGADERKAELDEARLRHHGLQSEVRTLTEQADGIPAGDRIPVADAQRRLDELRAEHARQKDALERATVEAATLAGRLAQRQELEGRCKDQRTQRDDYRHLVELFGRDGLQAWLVQEAQLSIGDAANEFLANISEGMLCLKMKPEGDDLEILVSDFSSGEEAMDISFISGSQRFRAAVALALAIGQYSGGGSRCIRSVIIDEGFGSLDGDGRREMIDQLKSLGGVLDRIILVSHQEEFHDAFPNGYHVEKCDGVSRAILRDGHAPECNGYIPERARELVGVGHGR